MQIRKGENMVETVNKHISKTRIQWLDVMKCFGIFAIYLGHFGPESGYSHDFVFTHHVTLFFFVSGCTEALSRNNKQIRIYLSQKVKNILVPYFLFALLSIIVYELSENAPAAGIRKELIRMIKGAVRNQFCAGALWFLTCLFVVQVMFILLNSICPKWALLFVSGILAYFSFFVMVPPLITNPRWFYNVDSAHYYFFYYVLGYLLFPYMEKIFRDIRKYKIPVALTSIICLIYAALLFFRNGHLTEWLLRPVWGSILYNVQPLLIIWLYAVVSRWLQDVRIFNEIGKNTLYLCGSEYLATTGINTALQSLGLTVQIISPMTAYIYSAILIWVGIRVLVPLEKKLFHAVTGKLPLLFFPHFYDINKVDIYTEIPRKERTDGTYDEGKSYAADTDKRIKK